MEPVGLSHHEAFAAQAPPREAGRIPRARRGAFDRRFTDLFDAHFPGLYRFLDRLSGEPELAGVADLSIALRDGRIVSVAEPVER